MGMWDDINNITWQDFEAWTKTTDFIITVVVIVVFCLVVCVVGPLAWYLSHKYAESRTIMLENGPEAYDEDDPRRERARVLRHEHMRQLAEKNRRKEAKRQRFIEGRTPYQRYNAVVMEMGIRYDAFREWLRERWQNRGYSAPPPGPLQQRPVELDSLNG
ncbi:unnamed protein product [Caenorhabditis nigoni]|uniref:Uncharacterized protein n=1 Tax=Caenorhabditis nigoni TaxID=1611254 RepID=A0A2G5TX16_9PELO|nr:hypothetical protein B9Z55_012396 [Caenorhabditis nigoni]